MYAEPTAEQRASMSEEEIDVRGALELLGFNYVEKDAGTYTASYWEGLDGVTITLDTPNGVCLAPVAWDVPILDEQPDPEGGRPYSNAFGSLREWYDWYCSTLS